MKQGKANFIIDAHFGSSGKGKMSTFLADMFGVTDVSSSNGPNAGHTAIIDGKSFVAKVLPTPAFLHNLATSRRDARQMVCWISPESYFKVSQFDKEIAECDFPVMHVHERAGIVTQAHVDIERSTDNGTGHIASTMQGTATAMVDKIMRKKNVQLARDVLDPSNIVSAETFADDLHYRIKNYLHLHEVSQGWALGVNYGLDYPCCTSRSISVSKALDDLCLPPSMCGDVYLNLRTFPIRVGNYGDYSSGPFFDDSVELEWRDVGEMAEMPEEEIQKLYQSELTTVTKRLRRVSTFPWRSIKRIARVTGATKLCLNFVQYLSWNDHKKRKFNDLSYKTRQFIGDLEATCELPVVLIGTGADHEDMIVKM